MKLSRLIPAIAAVGGAVAFAVYKMQKNKKEIMKQIGRASCRERV